MNIAIGLDGDVVHITVYADDEASAEHHYDMLERQLAAGRIDFSFRNERGEPPKLERMQ